MQVLRFAQNDKHLIINILSSEICAPSREDCQIQDERSRDRGTQHRTSEDGTPVGRNRLKGAAGNAVNAVLAAAAMSFQKQLRAVPGCLSVKSTPS
jgi:hypothetical protein